MDWFVADGYWLGRLLFSRALAAVYLVGFASALLQFRPLLGQHGLTPVPAFTRRVRFRRAPSLFWFHFTDRFFAVMMGVGLLLAAAALVGVVDRLPLAADMAVWAVLWLLYLSVVNVGQAWYAFGWESLLCEAGFLGIFLGNAATAPPVVILWLLRWLLFRVEFGAGLIKIRGDPCWRNLTCLDYHHETQPMPGPLSWRFHRLPRPLHRVETGANHVTQLALPFLLFTPQPVAGAAAAVMVLTQLWLVTSGNFAWLNWLTIVLALPVVGGLVTSVAGPVLPLPPPHATATPLWYVAVVLAVGAAVLVLSYWPARNLLSRRQVMNASFNQWHLVNTYGAFGSVTKTRYEVVVQGTHAEASAPDEEWRDYEFKGKPGDVHRRPPQVAPYHLRLDWLMWFAALSPSYAEPWLPRLARKLLSGDQTTLRLLRHNPFPDRPPRFVRAQMYRYRFTTRAERRRTGAWWHRSLVGDYLRPMGG